MDAELKKEKEEAISIAKDLLYGKETIEKIKRATNVAQITNIMVSARHAM